MENMIGMPRSLLGKQANQLRCQAMMVTGRTRVQRASYFRTIMGEHNLQMIFRQLDSYPMLATQSCNTCNRERHYARSDGKINCRKNQSESA